MEPRAFYVAGRPAHGEDELTVIHPYDGQPVGRTTIATADQVEAAVAGAAAVAAEAAALPAHARAAALDHVSRRLAERADEVAALITAENGKPVKWAKAEVGRAVSTFRWAAEEARRFSGDLQRLDTDPATTGRIALVRRVPRGPVLGITPFNFPLNLVAHKVAPALAVGAPIVVKPAPATPLTALLLGEILAETDLPEGMFSVLPLPNERAAELVADPRLPVVSFTGSGPVGAAIRRVAPDKHVTLELGGNAAAVICEDWAADEDLTFAAHRIATFSNYQAGQSCIAVQRVYVHEWLYDGFLPRLVAAVQALRTGDPRSELTDVGPLVSVEAAQRVATWVHEAVAAGAVIETGGRRDGATYPPTVLSGVPADAKVCAEEVFGPVLVVAPVANDRAAFAAVNDSAYGLQAGVFTHRLDVAFDAARTLEVGGVIIGDVPSYRADQMPYGGVKGSGVGREGLRSAMDDYTEPRVTVLTGVAL
ncbi:MULTISPECIES: aldehyde dehydrogenase family protein [unclassified Micromonospora]|uniref:aldehyde dehydrogenase family protein n=1 Tax=unclassified Micromonospora TaxID=2617518 RepID=UPI001B371EB8|nr:MULTISPECIES: aldehyde dehydrogenase family protein [unclassified Micromonospora]MBQ1044655.1 aldehyde dehydrogenase family protein [Micromonospora sp. C72]MBQ1055653.1 aldehyde dehydrogenase family protein [Micromonospora sp. C32]